MAVHNVMACNQLTVQEYLALIANNPNAKGYSSASNCNCETCQCDFVCSGGSWQSLGCSRPCQGQYDHTGPCSKDDAREPGFCLGCPHGCCCWSGAGCEDQANCCDSASNEADCINRWPPAPGGYRFSPNPCPAVGCCCAPNGVCRPSTNEASCTGLGAGYTYSPNPCP